MADGDGQLDILERIAKALEDIADILASHPEMNRYYPEPPRTPEQIAKDNERAKAYMASYQPPWTAPAPQTPPPPPPWSRS